MPATDRLTLTEAAAKIGTSEKTLRRAISGGVLPCERVSGRILIDPADLTKVPQGALTMASETAQIRDLADALRGAGFAIPDECCDLKSIRIAIRANPKRRAKQPRRDDFGDDAGDPIQGMIDADVQAM